MSLREWLASLVGSWAHSPLRSNLVIGEGHTGEPREDRGARRELQGTVRLSKSSSVHGETAWVGFDTFLDLEKWKVQLSKAR
jgi:hypothetical protein